MTQKRKIALVTGSTSGIGLELARHLAREGTRVVLTGRRKDLLDDILGDFSRNGWEADAIPADLATSGEAERLFRETLSRTGDRLDILVNNAGVWHQSSVEDISRTTFRSVMSLNLETPFILSGLAIRIMKQQGGGTIVNISSVAGIEAWAGSALYRKAP